MASAARYVQQERKIAASDSGGIWERWRWGMRLLRDDKRITPNGNLRNHVLDELIQTAAARGYRLGEREIQRRLRAAKMYPTEGQLRQALTEYETWWDLIQAGFPAYEMAEDEPLADIRDTDERARDLARDLADKAGDQMSLFPDDAFGPLSTLAELKKHADEMVEMTRRFHDRDVARADYLKQLIEAVEGDMSATWEHAERELRRRREGI